uniref:Glucose-methanol-choline oxidoreductase N-terminal domain-containing protein n=1 Tax=Timema shepardi TaxID=629360 RepID=A0A7R9FX39_TIMSH|nr:unnamed protein product [Timema shepardi]
MSRGDPQQLVAEYRKGRELPKYCLMKRVPYPFMKGKPFLLLDVCEGKVMGGTSVLHGMMYMRGHPWDYDRWVALGVNGWTFKDVLPYFIKSEDNRQIGTVAEPQYHGTGGYLTVQRFTDKPPLIDAILAGARELGCDTNVDLNGKRQLGFSVTQATVTKVIVDPITRRALGVQYRRRGETFTRTLIARKEVILCAGAIQSPQLLLLSGIGPASELLHVGIPVVYNLPRVGKNLVNHVSFTLNCLVSGETAHQRLNKKTLNQFLHTRSGPMASTGLSQRVAKELMCFEYQLTGFVRLNLSDVNTPQSLPDIQVFFAGYMANDSSTGCLDEIVCDGARYINIVPTLLRPRSKGELTLKSSDAMEPPSIKANYLQHQEDVDYLIEAIRFCERLIQTEPMRRKGVKLDTVLVAGCQHLPHGSRNYWECAIRHLTNPENHQVGTCAMGRSEMDSVLDSRLRVHGLKGLRVVDASAIPMVPSGNINAPIIMLAERGADFIKQEHDAFLTQPAFKRSNIILSLSPLGSLRSVLSLPSTDTSEAQY